MNIDKDSTEQKLKEMSEKLKGKSVIIYAVGSFFQEINEFFDLNSMFKIVGVSDSRFTLEQEGEDFLGYKIIHKSNIFKDTVDYILVGALDACYVINNCFDGDGNTLKLLPLVPSYPVSKIDLLKDAGINSNEKNPNILHSKYGRIYFPTYNSVAKQSNVEPQIYSVKGSPLRTFFLRDIHFSNIPFLNSATPPDYYVWDRFNWGLDVHFYTHNSMLEIMGNPKKRYGLLIEGEEIVPYDYNIFERNEGLEKEFDLIFTHSERILNKYDNARLLPFCSNFWYGNRMESNSGSLTPLGYTKKEKDISILASNKNFTDCHNYRVALAKKCKAFGLADTYGNFDGGEIVPISLPFEKYRYSIVVENEVAPYWFTEKITNCFASMTIPIYCGASKIDDFFNPEGIIKFSIDDYDNIEKILSQCTEKEYFNRLEAIKDNYNRVQKFASIENYLYKTYLEDELK